MVDILERSRAARLSISSRPADPSKASGPVVQVGQSAASAREQTDFTGPLDSKPRNTEWSSGPADWTTPGTGPLAADRVVQDGWQAKQLADNDKAVNGPLGQLDHSENGDPAKSTEKREKGALAVNLSRLQAMPYPADIEIDRWALFLADAAAFVALWGPQAERTGWQPSDLFAVPGGLCWALEGREVVALSITPSEATIRAKDAGPGPGASPAFHRLAKPLSLPWEPQP
jgi:hypothetical protein